MQFKFDRKSCGYSDHPNVSGLDINVLGCSTSTEILELWRSEGRSYMVRDKKD
jgi:hypothetical protein